MKKVFLTVLAVAIGFIGFAQDKVNEPQRLKYVTIAPDGSVGITIYDDMREDTIKLESAIRFYRYEILDPMTSELVFSSKNNGKACSIDKTKIASGTYNLRLYTSNFVITSKIAFGARSKMAASLQPIGEIVASK